MTSENYSSQSAQPHGPSDGPSCAVASGSDYSGIPLFAKLSNRVHVLPLENGLLFQWTRKGVGFGELLMRIRDGKLIVDTECMGPDFCADVVKQAIIEASDPNSDNHAQPQTTKRLSD